MATLFALENNHNLEMNNIIIRPIEPGDNRALASIIRKSLEEFGANKPGTVYYDKSTDQLFELFKEQKGSAYYVAVVNGELMGGAGIYPTSNLPAGTVELVKMYLTAAARGKGIGKLLMQKALDTAKEMHYTQVYIETMPELVTAIQFYEKTGFGYLPGALGNSGHTGCTVWMQKKV